MPEEYGDHRWVSPFSPFGPFSPIFFANGQLPFYFFINKHTNDKLPFAQLADGKCIQETPPGFRFPFSI
jgi:hypothetical protein